MTRPPDDDRAAAPSLRTGDDPSVGSSGHGTARPVAVDMNVDPRGDSATLVVTSEHDALSLVHHPIAGTVRRVALPAVASNLLMTLFGSADAFWVGTRVGSAGLAA